MPPIRLAFLAVSLACAAAHAGVHIEVAGVGDGPDGSDTFGAAIGQTDTLSVWIWSDEPGLRIRDIQFDLIGTVYGSSEPNGAWFEILSLGAADPDNAFDFFALSGDRAADGSAITGVAMAVLPFASPPVELPVGPNLAMLIYADFTGRPHVFTGGVRAANITVRDENFQPVNATSHGWYQIPTPGVPALAAAVGALALRRRRA